MLPMHVYWVSTLWFYLWIWETQVVQLVYLGARRINMLSILEKLFQAGVSRKNKGIKVRTVGKH